MAVGSSDVTAGLKRDQANELIARLFGRTYHACLQSRRVGQARNPQKQTATCAKQVWKMRPDIGLSKPARNCERASGRMAVVCNGDRTAPIVRFAYGEFHISGFVSPYRVLVYVDFQLELILSY
jgi:hypothetical protein